MTRDAYWKKRKVFLSMSAANGMISERESAASVGMKTGSAFCTSGGGIDRPPPISRYNTHTNAMRWNEKNADK